VLGDPLYGKPSATPISRVSTGWAAGPCAALAFSHPITGDQMRFETEPPEDFQRALRALRLA
jgi:hypothetical protein